MKFIDILVQELPKRGGWPDGMISVAQSRMDGELYFYSNQYDGTGADLKSIYCLMLCDDCLNTASELPSATREQYEAALAATKTEWDGDGLPPVGVDVLVIPHNNHWGFSRVGEFSGKILAFDGEDFWFKLTNGGKIASRTDKVDFRPIRTEQEEKKLSAIDSLVEFKISYHSHPKAAEEYLREMSSLYDAIAAGKISHIRID